MFERGIIMYTSIWLWLTQLFWWAMFCVCAIGLLIASIVMALLIVEEVKRAQKAAENE